MERHHLVSLSSHEWKIVMFCVQQFDFNPADKRPADIVAKIKAQTNLKPLTRKPAK